MRLRLLLACAILLGSASCTSFTALPRGQIEVVEAGFAFDGGSTSVTVTDTVDATWRIHYPLVSHPMPGIERCFRVVREDDKEGYVELAVGSDEEAHIYNQLVDWLTSEYRPDDLDAIDDGTYLDRFLDDAYDFFDGPWPPPDDNPERDRAFYAGLVIDLLKAITVERFIAGNQELHAQRDEITEEVDRIVAGNRILWEFEMPVALARWDQFYATVRAVTPGTDWTPNKRLKLTGQATGARASRLSR